MDMVINNITVVLLISTAVIWIVWDIYLYVRMKDGKQVSTLSMILTDFSWYSPALPFFAGVLMGHWWW